MPRLYLLVMLPPFLHQIEVLEIFELDLAFDPVRKLRIRDKLLHGANAKVSDGSQPPVTLNLSLSESAGSRSLDRLVELSRYAASARLVLQQHRSAASCPHPTRIVVYEKHQTFINYRQQPKALPHRTRF